MATSFNPNVLFEMRRSLAEFWAKLDLKNLKQHESVEEYINKFNSFTIDPLLPEDFKIYWFIKGLTAEISSVIEIMCPSTILEAMYYARMQEKLLEVNRRVNQDQHEVMNACTGLYLPCVLASEENCSENTSEEEEVINTSNNLNVYFHETEGTQDHVLNYETESVDEAMLKTITDKIEKQVPLADLITSVHGSIASNMQSSAPVFGSVATSGSQWFNGVVYSSEQAQMSGAAIGPIQIIRSVPSSSVLHFHLQCLDSITYCRYQHTMRATMAEIQVWNHNYKAKQILNGGGSNIVISGGSACSNVSNHEEVSYNSSADHCLYEEIACFRQRLLCDIEAKSSSKQADIPSKGKVNAYACFLSPETSQERILECYECLRPQNSTNTLKGAQDKKVNEIKGDFPEGYNQQNEGGSTMEDCTLFESLPQIVLKNIFGNECPALAQGSFIGLPQSPSGWIATKR